jgi:putative inorganic carbon (HCO3(-)) transporter
MKQASKAPVRKIHPKRNNPLDIVQGVVILVYILIPTFTPNLLAFDTNAPKFLAMAIVNLLAFITLLTNKQIRQQPGSMGFFFKTGVGLVYLGFLAASLLSLVNATNVLESVLQLTKVFTVFSAVFILSVILMRDLRYLKWIVVVFAGLLIFDSISVFYYINEFIQGRINTITDIKSIYSNKNILASAIYVKLPFALWLMVFSKSWLKWLGWFGLLAGVTATFFMATRAFYLGLIVLTAVFLAYMLFSYLRKKQKTNLQLSGFYLLALALAYLAFTGTQQFLYPKSDSGRLTLGVGQQLATISTVDASAKVRLQAWKWSWEMLREKPLLGVGSGNWKVVELKYENKKNPDYIYANKAHNDFLETAAETGFIGGLLYLGIFAMIAWAFLRQIFTGNNEEDELFRYLFLAVSGIAFYAVDAFFNFPADRPEILVLFSFYVAAAISVIHHLNKKSPVEAQLQKPGNVNSRVMWPLVALAIIVLAGISWIAGLNFKSSKTQRIIFQEIKSGKLKSKSDKIIAGFPFIPNLTILAESISTQKARYLLNEGKNEEAIAILRADRSNPWDGRREYYLAMGFNNLKQTDSALVYAEKMRMIKPNHAKNFLLTCNMLEERNENEKVSEYIDTYLSSNKTNDQAWLYAAGFFDRKGDVDKAWDLMEEAIKYLPNDTIVKQEYKYLYDKKFVNPYRELYTKAYEQMEKKNYPSALEQINQFIEKVPGNFNGHKLRAYIYCNQSNYRKCIEEIEFALTLSAGTGDIFNLRGICHHSLKELDAACKDFKTAMQMGNEDGKTNYGRFCQAQQQ